MLAYHDNPQLKALVLAGIEEHRKADRLVRGRYWEDGKGCAVGCTLETIRQIEGLKRIDHEDHALYERYMGVPRFLARIEDGLFERLPTEHAMAWPARFAAAIRPGADLALVHSRFLHWLLVDPAEGVARFARTDRTRTAIERVGALYARRLAGDEPSTKAWADAAAAAYAADAAAAIANADAAAYAAAAAAARQSQREKLRELLPTMFLEASP